jgi:hypothetical protein
MEVRKLFVNCCRVYPERCLELIVAVMCSFPQPWSNGNSILAMTFAFSGTGNDNPLLCTCANKRLDLTISILRSSFSA